MKFVLDTCAVIFLSLTPQRLSEAVRRDLEDPAAEVEVLAASAWEIACAVRRQRLQLDRLWPEWFQFHVARFNWSVIPIGVALIEAADKLPVDFHEDPIDRLVVAQARLNNCPVVTTDTRIRRYRHVASLE